jgi:hypothetical protein
MEFLPPAGVERSKGKGKETTTRVRLAWYYRPGDLSDRQVSDVRLLLAAIFSEILPVGYLRTKCYVRHKDKISDLGAWKKLPDHFYFYRAFDPYIKKEFEVLRTRDINNCKTQTFALPIIVCWHIFVLIFGSFCRSQYHSISKMCYSRATTLFSQKRKSYPTSPIQYVCAILALIGVQRKISNPFSIRSGRSLKQIGAAQIVF